MFGQHHMARGAQGCGPAAEQHRGRFGRHMGEGFRRPKYNVPVNIVDNETAFEAHVYAVGFAKENIRISVTDDILYVTGTKEIAEGSEPKFSRQEFPVKNFERVLALNGQVDIDKISAAQQNGILVVNLPKNAEAQKPSKDISVA